MTVRKPISKRTRFEVFKRDSFTCQYCGRHPPDATLEIDHIVAVANGGQNDESNLLTSCLDCNRGKSHIPLSVAPKTFQQKTAELVELESQIRGYQSILQEKSDRLEEETWEIIYPLVTAEGDACRVSVDWFNGCKMFIDRLGRIDVKESMALATTKFPYSKQKAFKYFCGICWNKIRAHEGATNG